MAELRTLRKAGVARATWHPDGTLASVDFAPDMPVTPAAPFVDRNGKPIDLDAGMPALARDPDDEPADREIERANFDRDDA